MYEFLLDKLFLQRKNNEQHHVFRNINMVCPSWEDILKSLDETVSKKFKLGLFDNLGFIITETRNIPSVNDFLNHISLTSGRSVSAHCYVSILSISKSFGRHNDTSDVYFWQVQGKTKWIVEDSKTVSYTLCQNDMIYIPKKMMHEVVPLGPRAGISFGVDY